jgi:hypothetical protein
MLRPKNLLRLLSPDSADDHQPFLVAYSLALALLFLIAQIAQTLSTPTEAKTPPVELPAAPTSLPEPTPSPTSSPSPEPTPEPSEVAKLIAERPAVERYIRTIFAKQGDVALAIARAESGRVDRETGQWYFLANAVRKTSYETSVGVFQINLKSEDTLVHYARIPGDDIEAKIEWLQDPFNNTLFAFWIYSHSMFWPWSTYSDGTYLKFMK